MANLSAIGFEVKGREAQRCPRVPVALRATSAVFLAWACSLGVANAAVYAPDSFAQGGGTNLETMVMVKDGANRVLVGGLFNTVEGQVGYRGVARYNTDDSLDASFKVATDEFVKAMAVQQDGKILIGGQFHWVTPTGGGAATQIWGIARLNSDGTLDTAFQNAPAGQVKANNNVRGIAVQPDGKIVIGGYFTLIDGVARSGIARLNADGTLDTTFNVGTGTNAGVEDVKLQSDGKIVIAGSFTNVQGTVISGVARLNNDGTLDTTFVPNAGAAGVINGSWGGSFPVYQIALQSDGKILINGGPIRFASEIHRGVARLNSDGTPDSSFKAAINNWGAAIAVQNVGGEQKIVVGGSFTVAGERNVTTDAVIGTDQTRQGIARFNADGTVDTTFDTSNGSDAWVWAVLPNNDGTVYMGGKFNVVGGVVRHGIARLAELPAGAQTINFPAQATPKSVAGGTFSISPAATASSGWAVSYSSLTPTVCTVSGTTVTPLTQGTCTIAADQAGGTEDGVTYEAAPQVAQSVILQTGQTINFPAQAAAQTVVTGGTFPIAPAATATSGLPVAYSSLTPSVCTVSGTSIKVLSSGTCTIAADQGGDQYFTPANQATQSVQITALPRTLAPVPTLETWALGLLATLLGVMGFRRRSTQ